MPTRAPQRRTAKKPAKRRTALAYEQLVKAAPKLKPPQSWYDETVNPFQPPAKPKKR
jgi:hypothetical protein